MEGRPLTLELNLESALQLPSPGTTLCSLVPAVGSGSGKWAPSSLVSISLSPRCSLSSFFQRRASPELLGWTGDLLFASTHRMFPHRGLRHPALVCVWVPHGKHTVVSHGCTLPGWLPETGGPSSADHCTRSPWATTPTEHLLQAPDPPSLFQLSVL